MVPSVALHLSEVDLVLTSTISDWKMIEQGRIDKETWTDAASGKFPKELFVSI